MPRPRPQPSQDPLDAFIDVVRSDHLPPGAIRDALDRLGMRLDEAAAAAHDRVKARMAKGQMG